MTDSTCAVLGSSPWPTTFKARSRSVTIPTSLRVSLFSITGTEPMFSRFIHWATFITESDGWQQVGFLVITDSHVCIEFSFLREKDNFPGVLVPNYKFFSDAISFLT